MTDKKLTDNEIIEAVKMCSKTKCRDCILCNDPCEIDYGGIEPFLVDLINRLQAQNKDLAETVHNLIIEKDALFDKAEELKAEVERLQNILICFMDALGKVRKVDDIDEISLIPLMSELNKQYRAELKAEAYKEFAERFKKKLSQKYTTSLWKVYCEEIDNLLKELVGEHNA